MTTEAAEPAAPEPADATPDAPSLPEPAPELEPEPDAATDPEPAAAKKPRRRGRTALIMAGAVVLGVLGGAGVGYDVQYQRPPTPLPPLSVAQPQYPAAHAATPALSAADDDMVKTDGDLTALLVPAPAGAKPFQNTQIHQWLNLADFSETFDQPADAYSSLANRGFRRAALAQWLVGANGFVAVYLVQFTHAHESEVSIEIRDQGGYAPDSTGGTAVAVPHSAHGAVYPGSKANSDAGGTYYEGRGYAEHGDLAVEVFIHSGSPVSAKSLLTLVQSQLERL